MRRSLLSGWNPAPVNPPPENHTFAELVSGREEKFPLLAAASSNSTPAFNLEVQWIAGTWNRTPIRWKNYCQIVRWPYEVFAPAEEGADMIGHPSIADKEGQLSGFLGAVEGILENGVAASSPSAPRRWCGGYRFFLGRSLRGGDTLILRPLREPMWRVYTHGGFDRDDGPFELSKPIGEWLAEFSLQVIPA